MARGQPLLRPGHQAHGAGHSRRRDARVPQDASGLRYPAHPRDGWSCLQGAWLLRERRGNGRIKEGWKGRDHLQPRRSRVCLARPHSGERPPRHPSIRRSPQHPGAAILSLLGPDEAPGAGQVPHPDDGAGGGQGARPGFRPVAPAIRAGLGALPAERRRPQEGRRRARPRRASPHAALPDVRPGQLEEERRQEQADLHVLHDRQVGTSQESPRHDPGLPSPVRTRRKQDEAAHQDQLVRHVLRLPEECRGGPEDRPGGRTHQEARVDRGVGSQARPLEHLSHVRRADRRVAWLR